MTLPKETPMIERLEAVCRRQRGMYAGGVLAHKADKIIVEKVLAALTEGEG